MVLTWLLGALQESATNSKAQSYQTQLIARSPVVDKSVVLPRFPQPQTSQRALPSRVAAMLNVLVSLSYQCEFYCRQLYQSFLTQISIHMLFAAAFIYPPFSLPFSSAWHFSAFLQLPWKPHLLFCISTWLTYSSCADANIDIILLKITDHFIVTFQIPTIFDKQGAQLLAVACLVVSRTLISDRIASLNGKHTPYCYLISFIDRVPFLTSNHDFCRDHCEVCLGAR